MRKILEIDQSRPGICTEAALAQAQFNLSEILVARVERTQTDSPAPDTALSTRLKESASLARRARAVLIKPQSLEPLTSKGDQRLKKQIEPSSLLTAGLNSIRKDHELALFDHLQPVFDGRFTGLHLLQYLRDQDTGL
jgi:hypothetical protein